MGPPSPSADGPALSIAPTSIGGPVVVAASADGPAETSTIGTGKLLPSGTEVNGVGPGSGTSSGRTANTFGRSVSSMDTSSAVLTSFCIALRPLLKAQDGLPSLSAPADVAGEQDRVGEDLLSQVRALQDSAPGLLGGLELAFELLDPQVPLRKGLLEWRHLSTVYFVPVFGPGEEAIRSPTSAVDHPLVFSGGGAAAQILDSRAAGGSSPCFISTSITGVVDPDPARRARFAGATSSTSTAFSFSFSFPCLVARVSPRPPLGSEACVAVNGSPAGTRASALGASVLGSADLADSAVFDPRLIFFAGTGGRAETGKLLMAPEKPKSRES
nr:hypothetical protein Iba_chr12bCG10640 [Ipomoea batatas]